MVEQRSPLRARDEGRPPVTAFELFFDLVFVFAATQLSHYGSQSPGLRGHLSRTSSTGLTRTCSPLEIAILAERADDAFVVVIGGQLGLGRLERALSVLVVT